MRDQEETRLRALLQAVIESKALHDYTVVNELFGQLSMQDTEYMMVGYLRATFSIRNVVGAWQPSLVRVYDELDRRGHDAPRLLRGLF